MDTNSGSKTAKIGILLVGHGSRLPYGKDVVSRLAEMYKENSDYIVEVGFMNISQPSIPAAINNLAKEGVKKIIVTPVFLAHGVHTKQDIPHILGLNEEQEHSHSHEHGHSHHEEEKQEKITFEGEIIYTEPLGADARLVDIIKDRVASAL